MKLFGAEIQKENIFFWENALPENYAYGFLYESLVNLKIPFDALETWQEMQNRIHLGVYMGDSLLLPHVRVSLEKPFLAFGVSKKGIQIQKNPPKEQVHFIAMLLSPLHSPLAHTTVISNIAKCFLNKTYKEELLLCANKEALIAFFEKKI